MLPVHPSDEESDISIPSESCDAFELNIHSPLSCFRSQQAPENFLLISCLMLQYVHWLGADVSVCCVVVRKRWCYCGLMELLFKLF